MVETSRIWPNRRKPGVWKSTVSALAVAPVLSEAAGIRDELSRRCAAMTLGCCRVVLVLALAASGCGDVGQDAAEEDSARISTLAKGYVDSVKEFERLSAQNQSLVNLQRDVEFTGSPLSSPDLSDKQRRALQTILEEAGQKLARGASRDADRAEEDADQLVNSWTEDRILLHTLELTLFRVAGQEDRTAQFASLLSFQNRSLWLIASLAIGSLVVIVIHRNRHQARRVMHGGKAKTFGVWLSRSLTLITGSLVLITVVAFAFGPMIEDEVRGFVAGRVNPLVDAQTTLDSEITRRDKATQTNQGLKSEWETYIADLEKKAAEAGGTTVFGDWVESRRHVQRLDAALLWKKKLAEKYLVDLARLSELRDDVNKKRGQITRQTQDRQNMRRWLAVILLGVCGGGHFVHWLSVFRQRAAVAALCPQCLSIDSLVPSPPPPKGMWECSADDEVEGACDLKLWGRYRRMIKVGFPTLGIPSSGKTHWLAMVYRQIALGNYPSEANIRPIDSPTTDDFDYRVDGILEGLGTTATDYARLPRGLPFEFEDVDAWGKTEAMVHIFDLAGETIQRDISNPRVVRALQSHGFLFFLDPTDEAGVRPQMKALQKFRDGVAAVIGPRLKIPVALCISKIDQLPNQKFGQGDNIRQFYEDIRKVGQTFSLEAMEERSRIVSRLRDTMWPGWMIEDEIRKIFGGRHLFFPMTPVGLENIGETDLKKVDVKPFAIHEPLFWLLHMSGYPVF
jgi:hypothetical protein